MDLSKIIEFEKKSDAELEDYQMDGYEVNDLRKNGELFDAYTGAKANYSIEPDDFHGDMLCLVYLDYMKKCETDDFNAWRYFLNLVLRLEDKDVIENTYTQFKFDQTIKHASKELGDSAFNQQLQSEINQFPWLGQLINDVENKLSVKEINNLRKAGRLREAYDAALKNYKADLEYVGNRNTLCLVYLDYLSKSLNNFKALKKCLDKVVGMNFDVTDNDYTGKKFVKILNQIIDKMGIANFQKQFNDEINQHLWFKKLLDENENNRYSNLVYTLGKDLKSNTKSLNEIIDQMSDLKTYQDKWLSILIGRVLKQSDNAEVIRLVNNIGWTCYRAEDYQPSEFKDYKTNETKEASPLVVRVISEYKKALLDAQSSSEINQQIKNLIDEIDKMTLQHHLNSEFIFYYQAQLAAKIDENQTATKSMLKFLIKYPRHFGDYWAWDKLGDFASDPSDKIALYCKALLCKAPAKNLIGIHSKLIGLFNEVNESQLASAEVNETIAANKKFNESVPNYLEQYQNADWYDSNAQPDKKTYVEYSRTAEKYSYAGLGPIRIYINRLNLEKNVISCVFDNNHTGFFKCPFDVDINTLKQDMFYNAKLLLRDKEYDSSTSVANPDNAHYKCITITPALDDRKSSSIVARLVKKAGSDFGFTSTGEFIGKHLIEKYGLKDKSSDKTGPHSITISGYSRSSWNDKKRTWSPEIYEITNLHEN